MARCAVRQELTRILSGIGASRRLRWRAEENFKIRLRNGHLRVAQ
ncbi:hypothetical protein A2U01_0110095, partial [Trifolium medium]|nr:hypothetical protein [Trifolium medium]